MVAPGEIVSIFGENLADGTQSADPPLPPSLSDTAVTIAGLAAPLLSVSAGQINAMVPLEAPLGTQPVTVTRKGASVASLSLTITFVAPGIFALGSGQGAILTATGEIAGPGATIAGAPARPALRGESISLYLTGLGDVTNRPASGAPAPAASPFSETILAPTVTIGGVAASPTFSGLAPSFAGLYQVNVQVPDTAAAGDAVPVTLQIGAATSNTVTMAVQ
jgi:uncharacterized protein (TIGR03437 family)